jgi:hypothetical protein
MITMIYQANIMIYHDLPRCVHRIHPHPASPVPTRSKTGSERSKRRSSGLGLWQDGVVGLPPKLEPNVAGHVEARDLQLLLSFWYKTQVGIASVLVVSLEY